MSNNARKLGELLVKENLVSLEQLQQAKELQRHKGGRLIDHLQKLGYVGSDLLADFRDWNHIVFKTNVFRNKFDYIFIQLKIG